jgi:hypothetical protein
MNGESSEGSFPRISRKKWTTTTTKTKSEWDITLNEYSCPDCRAPGVTTLRRKVVSDIQILVNRHPVRCALKLTGRQIKRINNVAIESNCSASQLRTLSRQR